MPGSSGSGVLGGACVGRAVQRQQLTLSDEDTIESVAQEIFDLIDHEKVHTQNLHSNALALTQTSQAGWHDQAV